MIRTDIVSHVTEKTGVSKAVAEVAINTLFDAMKEAFLRRERIELRGFGVFVVRARKLGMGRNPRTGEVAAIVPGLTVRFKPGKELTPEPKSVKVAVASKAARKATTRNTVSSKVHRQKK